MPAKYDCSMTPTGQVAATDVTQGSLLGGRVRYAQPRTGFRSGIEPVLLAACIPAQPGQRVIEAGTGAGAALLCLAARVRGIAGTGVERDPEMAALARANAAENGFDRLDFLTAAIEERRAAGPFDHAFANPPYHAPGSTPSPLAARESAKRAQDDTFTLWAASLAAVLRPRGTLTMIVPSGALSDCLRAMQDADCPVAMVLPLWPKPGREAKLLLLQGIRHGRRATRLRPGLVLHAEQGGFTPEADAVLRYGSALGL